MKSNKIIFLVLIVFLEACGAQQNSTSNTNATSGSPSSSVQSGCIKVTVNGSLCGSNQYFNQPCMSVTVNGQVIDNILLDTGSFGLRVFKSALKTQLDSVVSGSGNLAECVQFGDGSSQWGPVKMAKVQLGKASPVDIPIMIIDASYATEPTSCPTQGIASDNDPEIAGFNGILGVGFFAQDCGSRCVTDSTVNRYFSCTGSSCSPTTAPLSDQVQNPAAIGNDGIILDLPAVRSTGELSVDGCLYLGLGAVDSSLARVSADPKNGYVTTVFNGDIYTKSFLDTGSNGLYFPKSSFPEKASCSGSLNKFYCPDNTKSLEATLNETIAAFEIANAETLIASGNAVFKNIGAHMPGIFDWGLPFFLGKKIYIGISETAPYWAY